MSQLRSVFLRHDRLAPVRSHGKVTEEQRKDIHVARTFPDSMRHTC